MEKVRKGDVRGCESGGGEGGERRTLTFFFEGEFALFVVIFVLPSTSIFTTLGASLAVRFLQR